MSGGEQLRDYLPVEEVAGQLVLMIEHPECHGVIVDLRQHSPTFRQWISVQLSADNRAMLFIPEGIAHGFQTLADDTEVFYQMSRYYSPESSRGVRWDDPAFGIIWPEDTRMINARDRQYPNFVS
jgi:dTDP-4-dehydrorhamnose 3,5-epimerase